MPPPSEDPVERARQLEKDAHALQMAARKSRLEMIKRMEGGASDDEGEYDTETGPTQEQFEALDEEQQMAQLLGFGDFSTTKGSKVEDNFSTSARGAMAKSKRRDYKQYMNRKVIRKDGAVGPGAGKGGGKGFGKGQGGGKGIGRGGGKGHY